MNIDVYYDNTDYFNESDVITEFPPEETRSIYDYIIWVCEGINLFNKLTEEELLGFLYKDYNMYEPYKEPEDGIIK